MALTIMNTEAAKALVSDEMPKMQRPGRKATVTIPEDVLDILSVLTIGQNAPLAVQPLESDTDAAKETKNEVVATVAAWNRIAKRDQLPFVFHIRTESNDGSKYITVYGRWPNADEVQNGDNDHVVSNDETATTV